MKHFLLVALILSSALSARAEISLVAILSHGDEITTFQSSNAFAQAVEAAVDGDVITLSSGVFTATDIKKNISIRGAGMMPSMNPTVINGKIEVVIDSQKEGQLTFEGVYINDGIQFNQARSASFLKCWITTVSASLDKNAYINDIRFIHCFITYSCKFTSTDIKSVGFINSYVKSYYRSPNGTMYAENCIIPAESNAYYKNCIIDGNTAYSSTFANCISNIFKFSGQPSTANNHYLPDIESFFKDGTDCYELKDEYVTRFLGNDGTQVGIHGGSMPFDPTTTSLKIRKFSVASRTTADGKLPIEIEVDGN